MFNKVIRPLLVLLLLIPTIQSHAAMVEAEGRAVISNKDIVAAREAAIKDASQQASMQAAVYVSSNQVVRDGILTIDNMQIQTLGQVRNIELLSERVVGKILHVRIKAEVFTDQGCSNGVSNTLRKKVAFTGFPIEHLRQASLGGLSDSSTGLPAQLTRMVNSSNSASAFNASALNIFPSLNRAATQQLDDGSLTTIQRTIGQMDVHFTVSGVIRDMSMLDPRTHAEDNYFIDLYNRLDYKSRKHLRNFALDLFIYDGFSGELLSQKSYQTAGLWNLDPAIRTGFSSAGFSKQDYGKQVIKLQKTITEDLELFFACQPFTSRISKIEGNKVWIDAGKREGLKPGNKFTAQRRSTFYTPDMRPVTQLTDTDATLIIEQVQQSFAVGRLNGDAEQFNIRPGDLVITR